MENHVRDRHVSFQHLQTCCLSLLKPHPQLLTKRPFLSKVLQTCELLAILLFSNILPVGLGEPGAWMAVQIQTKVSSTRLLSVLPLFSDPIPPRSLRMFYEGALWNIAIACSVWWTVWCWINKGMAERSAKFYRVGDFYVLFCFVVIAILGELWSR